MVAARDDIVGLFPGYGGHMSNIHHDMLWGGTRTVHYLIAGAYEEVATTRDEPGRQLRHVCRNVEQYNRVADLP